MNRRYFFPGLIMLFAIILTQGDFRVSANDTKPLSSSILELYGLQDFGEDICNYSKYSITNEGDIASRVHHNYYSNWKDWTKDSPDHEYTSPDLEAGQSEIFDMAAIPGLPNGFGGYVVIASTQLLSGNVTPLL